MLPVVKAGHCTADTDNNDAPHTKYALEYARVLSNHSS